MQVNVFVTRVDEKPQPELLVLPTSPEMVLPPQYQVGWNYYGTVNTGHPMFGEINAAAIEIELAKSGFAVVRPVPPDYA